MLPPKHNALVQEALAQPLILKSIATPQPTPGAAVIRVLAAPIISYAREVYNGNRNYKYAVPLVPGTSAIGRIAAVGSDAVLLKEGDLVYTDCTIRARDDDDAIILAGTSEGGSDASRKLMAGEWRDATCAEYAKVPLENTFLLDEHRLCRSVDQGGMGYTHEQLAWILQAVVPYGGLESIGLKAGETIIMAPATGGFGSAGVVVALAMGARVIAMGRNVEALAKLKALSDRVETVPFTGNLETELAALKRFGKVDAFFDISPKELQNSTHFKAAVMCLRNGGRVSLMGGFLEDLPIPHRVIMRNDITLKGKWMYTRAQIQSFLRMINTGVLDFRHIVQVVGQYKLEDWKAAFDAAWENGRLGQIVVFNP